MSRTYTIFTSSLRNQVEKILPFHCNYHPLVNVWVLTCFNIKTRFQFDKKPSILSKTESLIFGYHFDIFRSEYQLCYFYTVQRLSRNRRFYRNAAWKTHDKIAHKNWNAVGTLFANLSYMFLFSLFILNFHLFHYVYVIFFLISLISQFWSYNMNELPSMYITGVSISCI